MEWFYKLSRKIRNTISAACWVVFVVFLAIVSRVFGDAVGENRFVAVITIVLFGVAVAASVFASKATKREKKAENEKAAAELKARQEAEQAEQFAVWEAEAKKREEYKKSLVFPDNPTFTVKLIKNANSDMQDNISSVNVGDEDTVYFDCDKELFLCCAKGFEVGYIPERYTNQCNNDSKFIISDVQLNENDKYSVVVDVYTPLKVKTQISDNADILPRRTKAKGVSFENRQEHLRNSQSGDELTIKHTPTEQYPNTISITNNRTGENLGNIASDLADELLSAYGNGCCFVGKILAITGGGDVSYGCNIVIEKDVQ
jgi:hypothetical protein